MNSLPDSSKIPIKNIYYMLCYAWGHLLEKGYTDVLNNDDKDINNLLTRILLSKLKTLIKRGFYKEYKKYDDEASLLRGKFLFKESINSLSFLRGKMKFVYEDMSHDILHNQIIKTILYQLGKSEKLDNNLKFELFKIVPFFESIQLIKLNSSVFDQINYHRNNHHYRFVLDICRFLFESLLVHENGDNGKFIEFDRNPRAMAYLFEEFVRSFYRNELKGHRVFRENIYWDALGENLEYLPLMQTDISIESDTEKIIMDTKYYQNSLTANYGSQKLISGNLYQLFAYLNNHKKAQGKRISGVLLYPQGDQVLNLSYTIMGYPLKVVTVDLNSDWKSIHKRLVEIVCGN
ncbi:5-methylcytosine restriction system specificity protein McrC [Fictibacillus barbaricus]|uniref:Restriction endonuclease n=1 Tax=Fictibacillus barbaricus TaxID=182136 RepID=A0ABS2ZA85_9BACL|nr:restriction endonuclease [Fictibacillus barbaricus]MBN3545099.1 restriction endonuclease [Fictibacillus barbaricus]GGB61748.1 5-methylcytosine-specific restriction system specificity protein McrC [Fictibacillus barbaricus]